jgi:glycosyltransferase involved in cell wall biosynthesis
MGPKDTEPKRILYVITKATWGGAQRYVYDLACAMHAKGHAVKVAYGTTGLLVEKLAQAGITTIELPHVERDVAMFGDDEGALHPKSIFSSIGREVSALKLLIKLFKEERPDVLHVNSSKIGGLGALAGRFAKVPRIIFTSHGWAFNEVRPLWQKITFHALYAITLWLSHKTICVSDAIQRDVRWFPFSHMTLVKLGIDTPVFLKRADARKKLGEVGKRFVLGMVAELHPTKRVEDAIRALKELKSPYPDLALIVLGEGAHREKLSTLIEELRLADSVSLKGFVPEASSLLPGFDMFLMPSRTEALGYAVIEAGYAGLPTVASRVGGLPEVIRHKETGLLVPPENPHALARAIRMLLDEPEYAKHLATRLKEVTASRFSKERMITETEVVYND